MKTGISIRGLAIALGVALIPSYVLCILGGELFGWHMYQSWAPLLPGFTWPVTVGGLVIGLVWLVLHSIYFAASSRCHTTTLRASGSSRHNGSVHSIGTPLSASGTGDSRCPLLP